MHILLVEDDPRMAALLQRGFMEEGHVVSPSREGGNALNLALSMEFDVVVLDVMLPELDGYDVLRRLRGRGNRTPVLMLTARDADADIVLGLNAGADDSLTKPFSFDVLMARVHALARRGPSVQSVPLRVADLTVDPSTHTARRGTTLLSLTRTEFSLLEYLMRRSGRAVTRQSLIEGVWGSRRDVGENTLNAFVKLLRQKVDAPDKPPLIHTIRGVGYSIRTGP